MAGTILYIDEAPELPEGTAQELSRLGYRLLHTRDPEEGLRVAREGVPRLALLEVLLEGCDGWELLKQLRACQGTAGQLPVVVLTSGERSPDLYGRAVELGASDFLTKPVLRAELLAAVLECAANSQPERQVDAAADPGDAADAIFSGDLADLPLPELLLRLRRIGANGVLIVQYEVDTHAIELRNGSPVAAATNRGPESLEDFLVRTKEISGEEHAVVTGQARASGGSTSDILVEIGVLTDEGLRQALAKRATEPMLEAFQWASGNFRFQHGKRLKTGQTLEFEQSPGRLLLEGALQWVSSRMIRMLLDRRAGHYVSKVDRPLYALRDLGPSALAPAVLDGLAGDRTVAEVLESGEVEERMLYGLLVAGLVEVHPEPVLELQMELVPEPVEAEPSTRPKPAATEAPALPSEQPTAPEKFGADATVDDPPADEGQDAEVLRRLDAESWFRRGEEFLNGRRYDKAVEAFGMAAHLDPAQGEYHAHLGYSLHLQQPKNELVRKEALEHIAKGIKLAPDRWKPLVFLARAFRAAGEVENAHKVLRRALKVDPDCSAARAELRLLKQRQEPESQGLLARVHGWFARRR